MDSFKEEAQVKSKPAQSKNKNKIKDMKFVWGFDRRKIGSLVRVGGD